MRRGSRFVMSHVSHIAFGSRAWVSGDTAVPSWSRLILGVWWWNYYVYRIHYSILQSASHARTHIHLRSIKAPPPLLCCCGFCPPYQRIKKSKNHNQNSWFLPGPSYPPSHTSRL